MSCNTTNVKWNISWNIIWMTSKGPITLNSIYACNCFSAQMVLVTCASLLRGNTQTYPTENLLRLSPFWSSWAWHYEGVCTLAASVTTLWASKDITWHQRLARRESDLLTTKATKCACIGQHWKARMGWTGCTDGCAGLRRLIWDFFSLSKLFLKIYCMFIAFVYFLIWWLCILCILYFMCQCCFSLMMFIIHLYINVIPQTLHLSIFVLPCSTLVNRLQIEILYLHINQQAELSVFCNNTICNCMSIHITVKLVWCRPEREQLWLQTKQWSYPFAFLLISDFDTFIVITSQISPQLLNKTALHLSSSSQTNAGALWFMRCIRLLYVTDAF